jgi:hypothetical protein
MEAPRGGGGGGQAPAAPQGRAPEKNQGGKSNSDRKPSGKDKN